MAAAHEFELFDHFTGLGSRLETAPTGTAHAAQQPFKLSRAVVNTTPSAPAPISAYPSTGPLAVNASPNPRAFSHPLTILNVTFCASSLSACIRVWNPQIPASTTAVVFIVLAS
ncbi:MAG: hypothetical protein GX616_24575 [Planctomycetes bacterium]|nr:hypothetical protein [Planctomycetota bacterium]